MKQPSLVGRTEELRAIDSFLEKARGGASATVIVAGEGGVGKTRLVSSVADRANKDGWTVAVGRAYPVETGIPFAVFSDALLPLLRTFNAASLAVMTRGGAAELRTIFPALESIASGPGRIDEAPDFKARMLWNFSQLLGRLSQKQPLLVVLENLHWADASSLELLHFVARNAGGQRLMILCTYNISERDTNPFLKATEHSLLQLEHAERIQLAPLNQRQVSELIQNACDVSEHEVEKVSALLFGWTRGNPFFVEEILKELAASGRLSKAGTNWQGSDTDALLLPATVREAIGTRLERLSADARELANLAAILGTRLRLDSLRDVSEFPATQLVTAIDELRSKNVIEEIAGVQPLQYDFTHPLLQQVLYSSIGGARASVLHARVAAALEKQYSLHADDHADELAYHYSRAHGSDSNPKAVHYMRLAGMGALARYANKEAVSYLRAALERADSAPGLSPDEVVSIVPALARALQRTGEYADATKLWLRSREEGERSGSRRTVAEAEHRIGLAAYWGGDSHEAIRHFDFALAEAVNAGDDALAVRIHLARAIALQDLGDVEQAKAGVQRALRIAQKSADDILLARVHRALLLLYAWTGPKESARVHGVQAIQHAEASGREMLEWTAHWAMSVLSGLSSDAEGVATHLAATERLNERLQSPILPIWTAEIAVQYLSGIGEWEEAVERGERAIESARTFGQRGILPRLLVWTGQVFLWRGDFERARKLIEEAWSLSRAGSPRAEGEIPSVVPAHHGMASLHLHTRNFEEAISVGEAGLAIADSAGYAAWALQWLLPVIGEAALWAKQWEKAEMHSRRMREDAHRLDHPLGLAWADACDGLLVMHRDNDPGGSVDLLRKAAERMEELRIPGSAAVVRRHLARALIDSGENERARKELKRAHDVLARIGARSELEAVRDLMRGVGARPPAKAISAGAGGLTGRELEIARLVAERKSNKEIGLELDISARTVSTHLSNIFLKVGVDSRAALTDYVRDQGLDEA